FDNILFASTEQQGIYRSTDGGNTWLPANNGITYKGIGSFAVNDNTILAGSATGIFRSTNNGESWSEVNTQIKGEYCWRLFVINDSTVLAGTLKGIFKSTDFGLTWRNTSSGITSHVILPIAEYNSDIYVGTINSGIYKSSDNGDSWTNIGVPYSPSGYSGNPYSIAGTDSTLFIRNDRDSLYKQNKISTLWEKVVPEPTTYYLNEIVSIKNVVILNTARGLYKSTDNGISWNKIKVDSTLANSQRFDLLFKHKEYLFVVSDNPKKLLRSSDLGNSWIRCNSGLNYLSFRVFTSNRNIIYAFIDFNDSSRFYKSYDDGFTWQRIFIPFIDMSPIRYTTSSSSNVIVASDTGGVLRSTDYGATWHNITSGLLNKKILSLYIKGTTLFAGTDGAGVWKYNLLSTDIPEQPSISGTHVRCYPNPANDELTISLTTTTELQQPLQYSITNILGTSVLQSQQMEKECTIPIHTLPSGVYYVTVAQSGVNATTMFSVVR
ncbi:MAG: T9SS type A sorting domain-containing protein, partial [Candidatus Kapabacteria bacterium]|nr:T9SS type A sorting domain-containing protein [Candidatus Kapabacteria bacterium]